MAFIFARLRQRTRGPSCVELRNQLENAPKYVSLSVLKTVFRVAGVVFTDEEEEFLVKRFADNRRRIEWRKLIAALDVGVPIDYIDPDRSFFDNLPQPYRLIVSVLDTEIIDRAWALIVERHPELDTNPADEARAAADIDLKRSCPPSVRLLSPHLPLLLHERDAKPNTTAAAPVTMAERSDGGVRDGLAIRDVNRDAGNGGQPATMTESEANNGDAGDAGGGSGYNGTSNTITAVQWDRQGELIFTAARDGSVCVRLARELEDIGVKILGRDFGHNSTKDKEEPAARTSITFLSRPVGSLRVGPSGRPSSVRIAAVVTRSNNDGARGKGDKGVDGEAVVPTLPPRPPSTVSVLEVTLLEPRSGDKPNEQQRASGEHGDTAASKNNNDKTTFRVICQAEIPSVEAVAGGAACTLSPDGRRLAVTTATGRVAIWALPTGSSPSERYLPRDSRQKGTGDDDDDGGHASAFNTSSGNFGEKGKDTATGGRGGDGGSSVGESCISAAREDDVMVPATDAVAATAADGDAAPSLPPTQLGQPEFSIPHLPSPEELAYTKALQEYSRPAGSGEIQKPTSTPRIGKEEHNGFSRHSQPPQPSGRAYHLARAEFIPATASCNSFGGEGGGLSVWRSNSNVCRFYRLPQPVYDSGKGVQRKGETEGNNDDLAEVSCTATGAAGDGYENADLTGTGINSLLAAKYEISSLPSAEWVLPSPITALAVSEEEVGKEDFQGEGGMRIADGDWSCCRQSNVLVPLVAVGTEGGEVYLGDALLATTREGLSKHRARVTALAFHRKRFLVSGSDDEMIQIHHTAVAASARDGRDRCCVGGTPRLRCLHDARGSGIVRVVCFSQTPLAFAEDTSGRIVAYDLPSGSMLGVLALNVNSLAGAAATMPDRSSSDAASLAETSVQKAGVVWAGGGDILAAVIPQEENLSTLQRETLHGSGETLAVWSAPDVMWELSPGMRAIAGDERPLSPTVVARLFYGLLPRERKDPKTMASSQNPLLPPSSTPSPLMMRHQHHSRRGVSPPAKMGKKYINLAGTRSATGGRSSSRGSGLGGRDADYHMSSQRPGATSRSATVTAVSKTTPTNPILTSAGSKGSTSHNPLTEGNVARLLGAGGRSLANIRKVGMFTRVREDSSYVPWGMEVGAAARVRRYMANRHTERAARQARLDNVTRNLLHVL